MKTTKTSYCENGCYGEIIHKSLKLHFNPVCDVCTFEDEHGHFMSFDLTLDNNLFEAMARLMGYQKIPRQDAGTDR